MHEKQTAEANQNQGVPAIANRLHLIDIELPKYEVDTKRFLADQQ